MKVRFTDILNDKTSGASTLYRQSLSLLVETSEKYRSRSAVDDIVRRLQVAFPEMAVFVYLKNHLERTNFEDIPATLHQLQGEAETAVSSIGRRIDRLWRKPRRIVTYSQSSVVAEILMQRRKKITSVLISCASPKNEGIVVARKLAAAGIPVALVTDAALPAMIEKDDYIFLGADAVTERYFVNKCGTWSLLLAAKEKKAVSFVFFESFKRVSCRSFSFDPRRHVQEEILTGRYPRITVHNFYFEKIPLNCANWLISDKKAIHIL